jgi:hypothetical protein
MKTKSEEMKTNGNGASEAARGAGAPQAERAWSGAGGPRD